MPLDAARWQIDILAADKTAAAFASVDQRMKSLQATQAATGTAMSQGFSLVTRVLGPLAAGLTAAAAAQKVWEAGMKAGELGEQAEQLGVSTDQLQAYRLAAVQSGVSVEQLDGAFMRLQKAMGEAADGNDDMIAKFDKLGVKLLDSHGNLRKVADVFPELARGLLNVGSESQRNALLMDFMGRSGSRMATVLRDAAGGSEALVAAAKRQGAVVGGETIDAWDKLSDQLDVSRQRMDSLLATLGKPIATKGVELLNFHLQTTAMLAGFARQAWEGLTNVFTTSSADLSVRQDTLRAQLEQLKDSTDALDVAKVAGIKQQLKEINDIMAARAEPRIVTTMPVTTVEGRAQPAGKTATAAGQKLDLRLKELQDERAALEKALAAFDVKGTETVDQVERRLNAQVTLDKKIFDVLKDVPPNSPLAQQLTQEATAVSQLNQKLDERKRLLSEGQQVTQQFGDGSAVLVRETAKLNELLAAGAITAATYARAMKELGERTDDQARAARGATGGWQGFMAGIEQGMADMTRANTAFSAGKGFVNALDESLDVLAGRSSKTFGQIAADFALMLSKMAMQAAASEIWKAIGGGQGIMNFLGGLVGGAGAGSAGGAVSADMLSGIGGTYASGGDYPAGQPRLTGEQGWEVDIPRRPGTILNQDQLAGMGGVTVHMPVSMHFGSDVSRAELATWGDAIMAELPERAVKAVAHAKSTRSGFRKRMRG